MATTQYTVPPSLASPTLFQHHAGVQYNPGPAQPANATTSPSSSISPPSPRSAYLAAHLQPQAQIRQPKTPLYIPAVLRPTEKPTRNSPPKSGKASLDGERGQALPADRVNNLKTAETSISRVTTEDWNDDALGKVTGPPTRDHWKVRRYFAAVGFLSLHRSACLFCSFCKCFPTPPFLLPVSQHCFSPYRSRSRGRTSTKTRPIVIFLSPPQHNLNQHISDDASALGEDLRPQSDPLDWHCATGLPAAAPACGGLVHARLERAPTSVRGAHVWLTYSFHFTSNHGGSYYATTPRRTLHRVQI